MPFALSANIVFPLVESVKNKNHKSISNRTRI